MFRATRPDFLVLTIALVIMPAWVRAQAADTSTIAGAWTMNRELSDQPIARSDRADAPDRDRRSGGGGGGRGGRGGYGGGVRPAGPSPEEAARMRDAMRDLTDPPDHLTITLTESMVIITSSDGRTTRLSPDGKKVKDENTNIERKTRWDGARLVSEINGLGPGRITQVFVVDPEMHRLRISAQMEGGRSGHARTISHIYDPDAR